MTMEVKKVKYKNKFYRRVCAGRVTHSALRRI